MITDNLQVAMAAINKWLYHSWNYDSDMYTWTTFSGEVKNEVLPLFLTQTKWTCNFEHMRSKWLQAIDTNDAKAYLNRFYGELDGENRMALLEWVINNYNDEIKFSF